MGLHSPTQPATPGLLQRETGEVLPRSVDEVGFSVRSKGDNQCGYRVDRELKLSPGLGQLGLGAAQRFL